MPGPGVLRSLAGVMSWGLALRSGERSGETGGVVKQAKTPCLRGRVKFGCSSVAAVAAAAAARVKARERAYLAVCGVAKTWTRG